MNKAILIGNVGSGPDLRHTPSGIPVTNFTLATNERWKSKTGNPVERTQWHRIVCWGRLAEIVKEHLTKGRLVSIEGRFQTRTWEDREGITRVTPEIVAQAVQFLGAKGSKPAEMVGQPPTSVAEAPPPSDEEAPVEETDHQEAPF